MATVYRKTFTKPLPPGVELFTRKGERLARWKDRKGRTRTAPVTVPTDGDHAGMPRIVVTAGTWTAKYRNGAGHVVEVPTGCRDETAARGVLARLERRAELVKAEVMTAREDAAADHQRTPLAEHVAAYVAHLRGKQVTKTYREDQHRYLRRLAADCGFAKLADLDRTALERWLGEQAEAGRSARSRNAYRAAAVMFCNWCVETRRIVENPFTAVPTANEKTDPRRKRRSLTDAELERLLKVARLRPLAEYGRETVRRSDAEPNSRRTWTKAGLVFETLDATAKRGRDALHKRPDRITELEQRGRERALVYKTLVLTGLRRGELASLTAGSLELDGPVAYATLAAADEKNREGSEVPLRADLAADLRAWLDDKLEAARDRARTAGEPLPVRLAANTPLYYVPTGLVRILDRDLRAAGIPKRDERGRTVDVHALRHSFGTHLSKGGVPLRTAQAAMRHGDPRLTANVYTDPKLLDVAGALDALPALPLDGDDARQHQQATGTDGEVADRHRTLAPLLAPNTDESGQTQSIVSKSDGVQGDVSGRDDRDVTSDAIKRKHPSSISDKLEPWGLEPQTSCMPCRRSPS